MDRQQTKTERTRGIPVRDEQGQRHTLDELTDFTRQEYLDGTWSTWVARGRRYSLNGQPVVMLDDGSFRASPQAPRMFPVPVE